MKKKRTKRIVLLLSALLLLCVFLFALSQLLKGREEYKLQAEAYQSLARYDPAVSGPSGSGETQGAELPPAGADEQGGTPRFVNRKIRALRADHPNALGWITVPGTTISYPFVQAGDNDYFLRRDLDGNYLYAGVPFLDYRCQPDCSGPNTILYAHNLRNGTMFGPLEQFREQSFFDAHREILIYLEDRTICAQTLACLVVDPGEKAYLYDPFPDPEQLQRLREDARCFAPVRGQPDPRFITLSTCGYEFNGARIVLVGIVTDG